MAKFGLDPKLGFDFTVGGLPLSCGLESLKCSSLAFLSLSLASLNLSLNDVLDSFSYEFQALGMRGGRPCLLSSLGDEASTGSGSCDGTSSGAWSGSGDGTSAGLSLDGTSKAGLSEMGFSDDSIGRSDPVSLGIV